LIVEPKPGSLSKKQYTIRKVTGAEAVFMRAVLLCRFGSDNLFYAE
jgi:hypothetical protein